MTDYRTQQNDDSLTHREQAAYPALAAVDLKREAAAVEQAYTNFVVFNVNDHCVRMAVMEGEFRWHRHPRSDECFLVLEGELEIDLIGEPTVHLKPGEAFTIPAGVIHRTRAQARTVNLCFENRNAYTDTIFEDQTVAGGQ